MADGSQPKRTGTHCILDSEQEAFSLLGVDLEISFSPNLSPKDAAEDWKQACKRKYLEADPMDRTE
jgi:hypothetical protein